MKCWKWPLACFSQLFIRVRTYWVILCNIRRYWIVLLLGDIFLLWHPIRNQSYSSRQHHVPVNDYLVPLVTCTLRAANVCLDTMLMCYCLLNTIIVIIIEFWDFLWNIVVYILLQINTLLCYTLVSVLVLGIGIARGQYYWILDIGCLAWYCSNPTFYHCTYLCFRMISRPSSVS